MPVGVTPVSHPAITRVVGWFSATLASLAVGDEQLYLFAFHIFNYAKVFALTSKHDGVEEEEGGGWYTCPSAIRAAFSNQI
jgi:hypothetical protein